MKKQSIIEQRRRNQDAKLAAELRGRKSQQKESVIDEAFTTDIPRHGPNTLTDTEAAEKHAESVGAEFIDSVEPPPPQLRRSRVTRDENRGARSKNTGIKRRDRSGAKHPPASSKREAPPARRAER